MPGGNRSLFRLLLLLLTFRMQMVCRVVVLLILSSCLCAATFVVNVTQSSSQAEQNHNITLEWTFTTTPDGSWRDLFIYCSLLAPLRESVLYLVQEGVEVSQSQDEQFAGRVQGDKDVLREGRIRLHLSSLRTEDSGLYWCKVRTEDGSGYQTCRLNVSAAAEQLLTHRPTWTPPPQGQTSIIIWITLGAGLLICIVFIIVRVVFFIRKKQISKPFSSVEMLSISQKQPLDSKELSISKSENHQVSELAAFNRTSVTLNTDHLQLNTSKTK